MLDAPVTAGGQPNASSPAQAAARMARLLRRSGRGGPWRLAGARRAATVPGFPDPLRRARVPNNHRPRNRDERLYALDLRASQFGCDRQRLAELTKWLDQSRTAPTAPAIYLDRSIELLAKIRSAWNSRDAETYRQLPADVRQKYAMFYDDVDNEWGITKLELANWGSLGIFSEPGPLSLEDRRKARSTITLLNQLIRVQEANIPYMKQLAQELGAKAVVPQDLSPDLIEQARVCQSVLVPNPKS